MAEMGECGQAGYTNCPCCAKRLDPSWNLCPTCDWMCALGGPCE